MSTKPTNIHVSIRRWRDRVYGNSYFSGRIFADGELVLRMPFGYGYGSHPEWEAANALRKAGILPSNPNELLNTGLSQACRDAGIKLTTDEASATKREVTAYGKEG